MQLFCLHSYFDLLFFVLDRVFCTTTLCSKIEKITRIMLFSKSPHTKVDYSRREVSTSKCFLDRFETLVKLSKSEFYTVNCLLDVDFQSMILCARLVTSEVNISIRKSERLRNVFKGRAPWAMNMLGSCNIDDLSSSDIQTIIDLHIFLSEEIFITRRIFYAILIQYCLNITRKYYLNIVCNIDSSSSSSSSYLWPRNCTSQ